MKSGFKFNSLADRRKPLEIRAGPSNAAGARRHPIPARDTRPEGPPENPIPGMPWSPDPQAPPGAGSARTPGTVAASRGDARAPVAVLRVIEGLW
jgi:hypothetical protein